MRNIGKKWLTTLKIFYQTIQKEDQAPISLKAVNARLSIYAMATALIPQTSSPVRSAFRIALFSQGITWSYKIGAKILRSGAAETVFRHAGVR
jgi:hypothetical protein